MGDGWVWQGRQEHGWFGDGTKPKDVPGDDSAAAVGGLDQRLTAVALGAVGHLPVGVRARFERQVAGGGLARLVEVMRSWAAAQRMSAEAFRGRFFGPFVAEPVVAKLRGAAEAATSARSPGDLSAAAARLAGAVQAVGVENWTRFVAGADAHARTALVGAQSAPSVTLIADDGTPGNNQAQNKQVRDVVRILRLNNKQRDQLHRAIHGRDLGYQDILQEARDMFGK